MKRFLSDRRGNIAVMFGLALIPLLGMVGAAMDYTRAADQLSRLQAAVDGVTLALTKLPTTATAAEIQAAADAAVRPYLSDDQVRSSLGVTATRTGNTIQVSANGQMPTRIISILGITNVPISASSTATWGNTRLRVALALDVTGSMNADGKLPAMKTGAADFITHMQGNVKTSGDVYVSVVPFNKDVNIGSMYYGQPFVKWSGANDTWDENNGTCNVAYTAPAAGTSKKSACEASSVCSNPTYTTQASCTGAGTCSNSAYSTQSSCTGAGTCSKPGSTTQSTCTATGTCSNPSYTTQSTCVNQCSKPGTTTSATCTATGTCSNASYSSSQTTCKTYGNCVKNNGSTSVTTQPGCNTASATWTAFTWTPATWMTMTWTPATWTAHTWTPYTWTQAVWTPAAHSTWNGCVMDRDQNYDITNTASGAASGTLFPAEQYNPCPAQLMTLSDDWTALKAKIDGLVADGQTNQQIGLAVAFQTLTSAPAPVPAFDPAYAYKQVIVLLTDGENTVNRYYANAAQIDARQRLLCGNVKAAGITLITVQVNTAGQPTQSVLQDCATTGNFHEARSAAEIITTLNKIGTDLSNLRLTR